ncbi:hypothetical protein CVU83_01485 [Candidatus Falkowbacteria bacterium HGW-Falkowbacteria-2]|uniref:CxxC-x17-CxxC domain-containing protein n=1 Tax=Candidatus Falkowbacteria bacterium HGW-Falkowbacteria-2 TaxID=2013769 RepID=A0A2N2E1F5_9BACT|nr:MAG: hypothetical protein CVU83_01485 [Candidatus Falkowbacteria bacterium HGW-Falkowbacteria-2]
MKDFNGPRKPGGFGGRGGDRGGRPSGGGFGGSRGGDRGGFGGRGSSRGEYDRPEMHKAICSDCGSSCEVPFRPNGTKPVLCSTCFGAQKGGSDSRSFGGGRERSFDAPVRTMFKATCQDCGVTCEVPFKPMSGKPVFCSDCFGGGKTEKRPERREERSSDKGVDLSALNAKLDKIITLLQGNVAPAEKFVMTPKVEKEVKEVKVEKVEKAEKKEKAAPKEVKKAAKVAEPKKAKIVLKVKEAKPKKAKAVKK